MGRNRSKQGILAKDAPERISKFIAKYRKLESYIRSLKEKLELPSPKNSLVYPVDLSVEQAIEFIKEATKKLQIEARELEKSLQIARRNGILKKESYGQKSMKLRKGRLNKWNSEN